MKCFAMACAASLLVASSLAAGELAVSTSTLDDMGFGDMERMSDEAGLAVRGKGASVWGGSSATWAQPTQGGGKFSPFGPPQNIAESANFYEASGPSSAAGGSLSFAGQFAVEFWADPTGFQLGVAVAGGIAGGGAFAMSM